jgi:histidinol phosphatase-like enzyme
MLLQAARDHGVDLEISWMIGDILNDVEAGNRAGCRTIHLNNGNETEWQEGNHRQPLHTVGDWLEAVSIICPRLIHSSRLKAPLVAAP